MIGITTINGFVLIVFPALPSKRFSILPTFTHRIVRGIVEKKSSLNIVEFSGDRSLKKPFYKNTAASNLSPETDTMDVSKAIKKQTSLILTRERRFIKRETQNTLSVTMSYSFDEIVKSPSRNAKSQMSRSSVDWRANTIVAPVHSYDPKILHRPGDILF